MGTVCGFTTETLRRGDGLEQDACGAIIGSGPAGLSAAAELLLGGDPIPAEEALRLGLVAAVCAPEELLPKAQALGLKIASRAPRAVAATKQALHAALELPLSLGNQLEQRLFSELFATQDQKEGMGAFLAKRPPAYAGK